MLYIILFLLALVVIIIATINVSKNSGKSPKDNRDLFDIEKRAAGKKGELIASGIIRDAMNSEDKLFTNVKISYEDKPAELDNVIVNKYGVFVIEVKSYQGVLIGNEDDFLWKKYKETDAGNVYEKDVKNPIKQVKRQVYVLAKYLKSCGADVWVEGYAYLLYGKSPVNSSYILKNEREIAKAIHSSTRNRLTKNEVEYIKKLLKYHAFL